MKERRIHTPEGVRDIYNGECARKNHLSERMKDVLKSYGYRDIQPSNFLIFLIRIKGHCHRIRCTNFSTEKEIPLFFGRISRRPLPGRSANILVKRIFQCAFLIRAMFLLIIPACRDV